MEFQIGDFVEIFYRVKNQTCRGEVVSVSPYQITIFVCYGDSQLLKRQVGYQMKVNLDKENKFIEIKKWETVLSESDLLCLMHFALQLNDKDWFETLGNRKKQFVSR